MHHEANADVSAHKQVRRLLVELDTRSIRSRFIRRGCTVRSRGCTVRSRGCTVHKLCAFYLCASRHHGQCNPNQGLGGICRHGAFKVGHVALCVAPVGRVHKTDPERRKQRQDLVRGRPRNSIGSIIPYCVRLEKARKNLALRERSNSAAPVIEVDAVPVAVRCPVADWDARV